MVLLVCLVICLYPVWRIRRTSIINMVMVGTRRHVFRNAMIGIQMAISLLFIGATCIISLVMKETIGSQVSYLSEKEEEHTLMMKVNSIRMGLNQEAILSDIKALPEVESFTKTMFQPGSYISKKYMNDQFSYHVRVVTGMPDYFRFFRIPMQGKEVEAGATNMIYVSKAFNEQLQKELEEAHIMADSKKAAEITEKIWENKIKKNSTAAVIVCFTQFLLLYFLFKLGCSPMWAFYVGIFSCVIFSYVVKPYILYNPSHFASIVHIVCTFGE